MKQDDMYFSTRVNISYDQLLEAPSAAARANIYGTAVADGAGVTVDLNVAVGGGVFVGVSVIVGEGDGRAVGVMISVPR